MFLLLVFLTRPSPRYEEFNDPGMDPVVVKAVKSIEKQKKVVTHETIMRKYFNHNLNLPAENSLTVSIQLYTVVPHPPPPKIFMTPLTAFFQYSRLPNTADLGTDIQKSAVLGGGGGSLLKRCKDVLLPVRAWVISYSNARSYLMTK